MAEAFHLGGWGMYPTAFFGLVLVLVSASYAVKPTKSKVPLIISTGILTLIVGAVGFTSGLIKTLGSATSGQFPGPEHVTAMVGLGESLHNIALALVMATMAGIAASIGAARLWMREERRSS